MVCLSWFFYNVIFLQLSCKWSEWLCLLIMIQLLRQQIKTSLNSDTWLQYGNKYIRVKGW